MGIFGLFTRAKMDEGIDEFRATEKAVLLDVRTPEEYAEGHVAGSQNFSLDRIPTVQTAIPDKDTPLFVYCLGGGSDTAAG